MSVAVENRKDTAEQQPKGRSREKSSDWSRRAPLLPALIFTIVLTQLPFVATLVISFMNWNAYYPDERGFAGLDNFRRVFTDENMRQSVITTIVLTATVVHRQPRAGHAHCAAARPQVHGARCGPHHDDRALPRSSRSRLR